MSGSAGVLFGVLLHSAWNGQNNLESGCGSAESLIDARGDSGEREVTTTGSASSPSRVPVSVERLGSEAVIEELRKQLDSVAAFVPLEKLARAREGKKLADAVAAVDKSFLFSDAGALALADQAMAASDIWTALDLERAYRRELLKVRSDGPQPNIPWGERRIWHDTVWVPAVHARLNPLIERLHALRVPPVLVQAFYQSELGSL